MCENIMGAGDNSPVSDEEYKGTFNSQKERRRSK
jgi:hypothetical protein